MIVTNLVGEKVVRYVKEEIDGVVDVLPMHGEIVAVEECTPSVWLHIAWKDGENPGTITQHKINKFEEENMALERLIS